MEQTLHLIHLLREGHNVLVPLSNQKVIVLHIRLGTVH